MTLLKDNITYDREQLAHHLEEGDTDHNENLTIYHPFCQVAPAHQFCNERFFNLEHLKTHIREKHHQCEICRSKYPYLVFKDLNMIKTHFRDLHFQCKHKDCINDVFVVFATEAELERHTMKEHQNRDNPSKPQKGGYSANHLLGVTTHDESDDDGYLLNKNANQRGGRGGRGGSSSNPGRNASVMPDKQGLDFTNVVASL